MGRVREAVRSRWQVLYRRSSIQMILSLSFTAVAVVGMVFMGLTLFLRFSYTTNAQQAENSQRLLSQVNWNLDAYLRGMMRISDTAYYNVIKNIDLDEGSLTPALELLYGSNRDSIVSMAVFSEEGELLSATPLRTLKNSVSPQREDWFVQAMDKIENLHFSTPHVQNLWSDVDERYRWVVSLSRYVELSRGGAIEGGVLLLDMSFDGIEQICKDVELDDGGYLYLIDDSGEIIYHPRQQLIYAGLQQENNLMAAGYTDAVAQTLSNTNLAQTAFGTVMGAGLGAKFVAVCLFFFAFSTILGWNLFGKINVAYLFGRKATTVYMVIALVFIFLGTVTSSDLVWGLSDMFNQLMVIPNAIALFALTNMVVRVAHRKTKQKK